VVFYCRSGNRSALAAAAFRQAGWDAYNLDGGIQAWVDQGLELDPPDGEVAPPQPVT
jgi:rhodanese-related sulfurtransferase